MKKLGCCTLIHPTGGDAAKDKGTGGARKTANSRTWETGVIELS